MAPNKARHSGLVIGSFTRCYGTCPTVVVPLTGKFMSNYKKKDFFNAMLNERQKRIAMMCICINRGVTHLLSCWPLRWEAPSNHVHYFHLFQIKPTKKEMHSFLLVTGSVVWLSQLEPRVWHWKKKMHGLKQSWRQLSPIQSFRHVWSKNAWLNNLFT